MNHPIRFRTGMAAIVLTVLAAGQVGAQPAKPATKPAPAAAPAAKPAVAAPAAKTVSPEWISPASPFRKLAAGVMQNVDPTRKAEETVARHDVTELLYVDKNFEFVKDVPFRHDVYMLEIKYKPMRMIWADLPAPNGRMQQKQIWYMVYQVTNPGKVFHPVEGDEGLYKLEAVDRPVRFIPVFTLEVHNRLTAEVPGSTKVYPEQYLPIVLPAIRAREDRNRDFVASVLMPKKEIAKGETVWGVATWQDVDPQNVWFSVYVEGLTNAYNWTDDAAKYAARSGPYREIFSKVLKLNFWRPGDEYAVKETQVRQGVPALPGGPAAQPSYEWIWRKVYPPVRP